MSANPLQVEGAIGSFLLSFPALFSIVNPIGSALIFDELTSGRSAAARRSMAKKVAIYSAIILIVSMWLGGYILSFFGISLGALRIAGGLVVAVTAWNLLMQPTAPVKADATAATPAATDEGDIAFFPLTMPLTTGPGTIAVAIALASQRPEDGGGTLPFFGGLTAAGLVIALLVWGCNRWSGRVTALLGSNGVLILSRLVAFLLLCIGTQIIVTGVIDVARLIHPGN